MANKKNSENIIPISDLIFHCFKHWYWFVISLAVASGIAVYLILSTPPQYVRHAEILIKEEAQGGGSGTGSTFKEFSNSRSTANAANEIKALQSVETMKEAIRRLGLDIEFKSEGRFYDGIIYVDRPLIIKTKELSESDIATFTAIIEPDSTVTLKAFTLNGEPLHSENITATIGGTTDTPLGEISIAPSKRGLTFTGKELYIEKKNVDQLANHLCSNLKATLADENTTIVTLSLKDISTARATDILNAIIDIYNEEWVKENNYAVIKTAEFINNRANEIKHELQAIDKQIATFRGDNKLSKSTAQALIQDAEESKESEQLLSLTNQLELLTFIKSYMLQSNSKEIIPVNTGINASGFEQLIGNYNTKLIERNRLAANSSESNPVVIDYDKDLEAMYSSIKNAIDVEQKELKKSIATANKEIETKRTKVTSTTHSEKELQTLIRQQKVKNALYLFLLQKLEETELSKEFSASNNRVLVSPCGSNTPVEPMQRPIIMLALILGLLVPFTIIFIRILSDRKVRGRKDLEGLDIPFIGEMPLYGSGNTGRAKKERYTFVVQNGRRDVINEAFRVMRTNLEFMNDKERESNVIITTSFNPGSGKTFLTMNLGAVLSIKGAKTLVIDGDLRRASASEYIMHATGGLSDYLSGGTNDIDSIITTDTAYENLDVITVGTPPPNPTELLNSERFEKLIEEMRKRYTYILIDCPPIEIVADTQILEKYCDRTLFVVRAGLLYRDMLDELQNIYDSKRLKGLAMILNGTHSGTGRYGYRYGYSYGYGYGYGYHYHQKK